jgi:outer membrane murein-binding lipoprotein Lpp
MARSTTTLRAGTGGASMSIEANQASAAPSGILALASVPQLRPGRAGRRYSCSLLVGTAVVCASFALSGCASTQLTVVNQSANDVRISGCFIDDSLDLKVGQSATQGFPFGRGRWGCDVYRYPLEPLHYIGCLVVRDGRRAYSLERDVDTNITEKACDRI